MGTASLPADIERASRESTVKFWGGCLTAVASFWYPILGVIAVYSGYRLRESMDRPSVGTFIGVLGLVNFLYPVLVYLVFA